jgi:hypothetical protein
MKRLEPFEKMRPGSVVDSQLIERSISKILTDRKSRNCQYILDSTAESKVTLYFSSIEARLKIFVIICSSKHVLPHLGTCASWFREQSPGLVDRRIGVLDSLMSETYLGLQKELIVDDNPGESIVSHLRATHCLTLSGKVCICIQLIAAVQYFGLKTQHSLGNSLISLLSSQWCIQFVDLGQ